MNINIGSLLTKRCNTNLVDPDLGDGSLSALGLEVRLDLVGVITQVDPAIMSDPSGILCLVTQQETWRRGW